MKKTIIPDQLNTLLINVGLTEKEAKIYEVLLERGLATAGELIEASGLKRGITYAVLYSLEKKKLVLSFEKDGKTCFQVEPPHRLMDLVEERKQQVDTMENSMKHVIKDLTSQYKLAIGKPTVQYFEGEEGIKQILLDISNSGEKHVYGCGDIEAMEEFFYPGKESAIIPNRIKNDVFSHAIFTDSKDARALKKADHKELRETAIVNPKEYPLPAEIDIYGDKVAMLSFAKNNFIGVIIENKEFADTLRSIMKIAFQATYKKEIK